jgi:hypothetical protein
MKIGIVADDYKVPAFEKALTEAGFQFKVVGPLATGSTAITVECEFKQVNQLRDLCTKAQKDAWHQKQKEN